jgi:hypothetical protein
MGTIYGLYDPRVNQVRYIGKTAMQPGERLRLHLKPSQLKGHTHKNCWLRKLLREGVRPEMLVLEEIREDGLNTAETFWIASVLASGGDLLNHTPGGDGNHRGTRFSEVTKAKMAVSQRARRVREQENGTVYRPSAETRQRIAKTLTGRKASASTRALLTIERKARYQDPAAREAQAIRMKAVWASRLPRVQDDLGNVYDNARDAAAKLGAHSTGVCRVLRQGHGTVKGRSLRYLSESSQQG